MSPTLRPVKATWAAITPAAPRFASPTPAVYKIDPEKKTTALMPESC
jgi:hypothetical protein